jgi:hypothetical protein
VLEYENLFGMQDMMAMMAMMAKLPMTHSSSDPDALKGFMFKGTGSWKVGNLDHFLPPRYD